MPQSDPVQDQFDAYNKRDLEAFLSCYAADVRVRDGDGRLLYTGLEEMRASYRRLFDRFPDIHAEVRNRLRTGSWTVDEEVVTAGPNHIHVLVAYLVREGLIAAVVMLTSDD